MSPKIVHKRDGYNRIFFKSGSPNDLKKQLKNKKIHWEVGACNKGLKINVFWIHIFLLPRNALKYAKAHRLEIVTTYGMKSRAS